MQVDCLFKSELEVKILFYHHSNYYKQLPQCLAHSKVYTVHLVGCLDHLGCCCVLLKLQLEIAEC